MTNTKLNKTTVTEIREILNFAVAKELKAMGLEGSFGNATFSDHSVSIKFEAKMIGERSRKEQDKYDSLIANIYYEYEPSWEELENFLEQEHEVYGNLIKFTGYNSRSKKMPIEFVKVDTGTTHKSVKNYLTIALTRAGIKKRLPEGATPAPSAAARAMAKAEAEWDKQPAKAKAEKEQGAQQ